MQIIIIHIWLVVMKYIGLCLLLLGFIGQTQAQDVTSVEVIKGKTASNAQVLTVSGTVESEQNARLAPLQSGVIEQVLVEAGEFVEKGQVLLTLDNHLARIAVDQAQADLDAARAALKEAQRLLKEVMELSTKKVIAQTTIGERKSQVAIAKAQESRAQADVAQRKEELARHQLKAPFAGLVAQRHIDIGEWVTQQTVVYTLVEQKNLRVALAIPQEYVARLSQSPSISALVMPDSVNGQVIQAQLSQVVRVANSSSRAVKAWVDLPQSAQLVVGMSAQVELELPAFEQGEYTAVWLPKAAIKVHPDGGRSVFVAERGVAKNVPVKIVETNGNDVAVTGVDSQANVIVSGVAVLKAGATIKVTGDVND